MSIFIWLNINVYTNLSQCNPVLRLKL